MKYLIPFFLFLFLSAPVYAATTASPTMEISYSYPVEAEPNTSHFVLMLDGRETCVTADATVRQFTCNTAIENRDYSVTLKAVGEDGVPDSGPSNAVIVNPPDKYFIDLDEPVLIEIKFIITDSNITVNIN